MSETPEYKYFDKQLEMMRHLSYRSPIEQALYGGAAGGGKSFLGCDWQIKRRLKYPGTRGLIGRAELKKLQLSTMKSFWAIAAFYQLKPGVHFTYNGQLNVISWHNGSETYLMDLDDQPRDPEFQRFGSMEITDYFVDEGGEVSKKAMDILDSRVRFKLVHDRPKGLISCNPNKGWIYNDFYIANREGYLPPHRAYVQALPTDNPHIDPVYLEKLNRLPEYDRQRLLLGNWEYDDSEGKMFETFDLIAMFRQENIEGQFYITADIAGDGTDKTIIILWSGMTAIEIHEFRRMPVDEIATFIRSLVSKHNVNLRNIIADYDGIGKGVADILKCVGFVNGSKARDPKYQHLKAECYFKLADIVKKNGITFVGDAAKPKAEIIKQLEHIKRHRPNADGKFNVTPKEDLKRSLGYSPDYADAIMMRMYFLLGQGTGVYVFG